MQDIKNFSKYCLVNNEVYRRPRPNNNTMHRMSPRKINGYMAYTLNNDDGDKKTVYAHTLIAEIYCDKPITKERLFVVHLDGDKLNNIVSNLMWLTFKEFMKNQFASGHRSNKNLWKKRIKKYGPMGGLTPPGKRVVLSKEQLKDIKVSRKNGATLQSLADRHGCSASHIYNLVTKKK